MSRVDWSPLRRALRQCGTAGVMPQVWWRDDDAVDVTPALETLAEMADKMSLPVHLAVIPAYATENLASYCEISRFIPVVHGWAHENHSTGAEKKNEFLTPRDGAVTDAARGAARLQSLFGTALRMMFVPPWNRVNDTVVAALPGLGFSVLSTYGPRDAVKAVPGLLQVNTHLDPINWRDGGGLIDPDHLVAQAAALLVDRAEGRADPEEPFGLLTHHLVHDPDIWTFAVEFMTEIQMHGARPWHMETTE